MSYVVTYEVIYSRNVNLEFSQYKYQIDLDTIYLFANKSRQGFLITKKKEVDYWILFHNTFDEKTVSNYISTIRKTRQILAVFKEDNKKIKEHFVF